MTPAPLPVKLPAVTLPETLALAAVTAPVVLTLPALTAPLNVPLVAVKLPLALKLPKTLTVLPDCDSSELPRVEPAPVNIAIVSAEPDPVMPPPEPVPQLPAVVQTVLSTPMVILPEALVMEMPEPWVKLARL